MVHRRHVNQEPSRKGDVAGNASALFGDGLFSDLYQDLLAFLQQVADGGQVPRWVVATAAHRPSSRAAAAVARSTIGTLGPLMAGGACCGAMFGASPFHIFRRLAFFFSANSHFVALFLTFLAQTQSLSYLFEFFLVETFSFVLSSGSFVDVGIAHSFGK